MKFQEWITNNPGLVVVLIGVIGITGSIIGLYIVKRSASKAKKLK